MAVPPPRAKFHNNPWIFGGFRPKKREKLSTFSTFSPLGANPLPDVSEICRFYAGNRSTEGINIWCDSVGKLGLYRQKTAMGISPQNFLESPSSETTGRIEKKSRRTSSIFMQSLVEIHRYTAAWETNWVVLFFLFVTLWILNLNKGLVHQRFSDSNSNIVAICRSILMQVSAFFRGRNALSNM